MVGMLQHYRPTVPNKKNKHNVYYKPTVQSPLGFGFCLHLRVLRCFIDGHDL